MLSIELLSPHCRLRLPHPHDSAAIQRYYHSNADFLQPWLPAYHPKHFELDHIKATTCSQLKLYLQRRLIPLLILGRQSNRLLGRLTYSQVVRGNAQTCTVGYQIGEAYNRRGLATEALQTANTYLFEEQGFHRIEALIMPHNHASIRVVEKLGFEYEGRSRGLLEINGAWQDHLRYALLAPST